ncbi:hypothetical protein Peur_032252 [Populus x canadensis]
MRTAAKTVVSKPPNPAYRDERSFAAVVSNAKPSDDSHKIISVTYVPSSYDRNWLVRNYRANVLIKETKPDLTPALQSLKLSSVPRIQMNPEFDHKDCQIAGLDKSEVLEAHFISGESMDKLDVWEPLLENDEANADMVNNVPVAHMLETISNPLLLLFPP